MLYIPSILYYIYTTEKQEQLVKRSGVKPIQDGGLFTMWFASGPGLTIYRCEVR